MTKTPFSITTNPSEPIANDKSTKSSIWTFNTIDIDYGMPTRHRRETEDTLSPVFTRSTINFQPNDVKTASPNFATGM